MTDKEVIKQLASLIINSQLFHQDEGDIWEKDIEALRIAIKAVEKVQDYEAQWLNDINNPLEPLKLSKASFGFSSDVTLFRFPKEYLRQLHRLELCIEQRQEELNRLRELIGSHAIDYGERVQTSPSADSIPNEVIRRAELEADISRKIERFLQLNHKIINEIQSLDNAVYVNILYKRYVEYKSLEEIAVEMNYSYRQVLRLHGMALQGFKRNMA